MADTAQLALNVDPARQCKPWRRDDYDPCQCRPCRCFAGCYECDAMPGEPGCVHCWTADEHGYRVVAWGEA